jgi:hypothetical protein
MVSILLGYSIVLPTSSRGQQQLVVYPVPGTHNYILSLPRFFFLCFIFLAGIGWPYWLLSAHDIICIFSLHWNWVPSSFLNNISPFSSLPLAWAHFIIYARNFLNAKSNRATKSSPSAHQQPCVEPLRKETESILIRRQSFHWPRTSVWFFVVDSSQKRVLFLFPAMDR